MKVLKSVLALVFVLSLTSAVFAQQKEMTQEEWQAEINRLTQKKAYLELFVSIKKGLSKNKQFL